MHPRVRVLLRRSVPVLPVALAAPAVSGQVVYTNPSDLTVSAGGGAIYFDLGSGGGTGSSSTLFFGGTDFYLGFNFSNAGQPRVGYVGPYYSQVGSPGSMAFNYSPSSTIFSGPFNYTTDINYLGSNNANWAPGTTGYLGLRVDAGGGNYNYAWAQISYNSDQSLTLHDFAYEQTVNTAILAGDTGSAIPEPSASAAATGLAALLAGSAALYARRRKQKLAHPAAA